MKKIQLTDKEWKVKLKPEQYKALRLKESEKAYSGKYDKFQEPGTYVCAACQLPLFSSEAKYDSGTGWPSFFEPIKLENVVFREDVGFFTKRMEVVCAQCGGHIGHIFNDGPKPSGKRYCVNSVGLKFIGEKKK